MIICHSRRFIMFCNPGTGTGPLLRLLAPWSEEAVVDFCDLSPTHRFYHLMPPAEVARIFAGRGLDFPAYRRITLVRDPFLRLQGLYRRIADSDSGWEALRRTRAGQPGFAPGSARHDRTEPAPVTAATRPGGDSGHGLPLPGATTM